MILSVIQMPLNVAYLGQFTRRSLELRVPGPVPAIHDETRGLRVGRCFRRQDSASGPRIGCLPGFHVEPALTTNPFRP
jgi:hypothetical protein